MSRSDPRAPRWRKPEAPIWRAPATVACRGEDVALFYKGEREDAAAREERTAQAKELCSWCPHRAECLEAAMAEEAGGGGRYGIRGGLTEEERRTRYRRTARRERVRAGREAAAA